MKKVFDDKKRAKRVHLYFTIRTILSFWLFSIFICQFSKYSVILKVNLFKKVEYRLYFFARFAHVISLFKVSLTYMRIQVLLWALLYARFRAV